MSKGFSAQISSWASASQARTEAVYRRSVELLGEEMTRTRPQGGRLPFDTGTLARSLLASTAEMPKTSDAVPAGSNLGVVTATLRLDQKVWLGYTANYARRQNFGFVGADSLGRVYSQQGAHFVEAAIAEWPGIVAKASAELQSSVESRNQ